MHDGDIDYSRYTQREMEEAFAKIDRDRYPRNFANLSAAYVALTAMSPPPPPNDDAEHDVLEDEPPPPQSRYDADGRYLPNHIPVEDRLSYLVFSVLLFGYGSVGVWLNNLYIPAKRGRGLHLHDLSAWVMYGAITCACLVMLLLIADHYDRRDNEIRYWHAARIL
ncbi:MAG: hypothetical protein DI537_54315, partial [Stutzerimonas stutzeri]